MNTIEKISVVIKEGSFTVTNDGFLIGATKNYFQVVRPDVAGIEHYSRHTGQIIGTEADNKRPVHIENLEEIEQWVHKQYPEGCFRNFDRIPYKLSWIHYQKNCVESVVGDIVIHVIWRKRQKRYVMHIDSGIFKLRKALEGIHSLEAAVVEAEKIFITRVKNSEEQLTMVKQYIPAALWEMIV